MTFFHLNNETQEQIRLYLNNIKDDVEFEIRFGKFIFNKETKRLNFESNVEIQYFYRLRNILVTQCLPCVTYETIEYIYSNPENKGVNKQIIDNFTNESNFMYKNTFKKYDVREYDFRLSLASEKKIQKFEPNQTPNIIRKKTRYSFTVEIGSIDMTIVQEFNNNEFLCQKYEIELEINKNDFEKTINLIAVLLQTRQENFYIIPSSQRRAVFNEYRELVGASYFIGAQAETLQKENINILYKELYSVTDKIDGDRFFLFVNSIGEIYFIDSNVCGILKTNILCPEYAGSIIDGELLRHPTYISFHAFDLLFFQGNDIRENERYLLKQRLECVEKIIKTIPKNDLYVFQMKRFIFRNVFIGSEILMDSTKSQIYENDGLIFTPMNEVYPKRKKWSKLLKWKPTEKNSIDFYIVKKSSKNGMGRWDLYVQHYPQIERNDNTIHQPNLVLFNVEELCGTKSEMVTFETDFPETLIDPTTKEPFQTNTVVEFCWDHKSSKFVPMRTRWDKTINPKKHGNFSTVALSIWNNIHNSISIEFLSKFSNNSNNNFFFEKMRRYHNKIKEILYKQYCQNTEYLLELCSGKGGDLHKWIHNDIPFVVGYDINEKSVEECYRRLQEVDKTKKYVNNYKFYTLDLTSDGAESIIQQHSENNEFDTIACQFGFHYFCESQDRMTKMVQLINRNLKDNGYVMLSFMDSSKLNQLFGDKNYTYFQNSEKDIVYYLKREQQISEYGTKLKVYLTGNNVLSDVSNEYIINFEALSRIFKENGFHLIDSKLFSEINLKEKDAMDKYETDISFLNRYCIFKKTSDEKCTSTSSVLSATTIVEKISNQTVNNSYKLIDLESQNIQLHKVESTYDIINTLNCIEYKYNTSSYNNNNINNFSDIIDLFQNLEVKYTPYFINQPDTVDSDKDNCILFYHNKYTIEKADDKITEYENWYIILVNEKLVNNSNVTKTFYLETDITNSQQTQSQTEQVQIQEQQQKISNKIDYSSWTIKQLQDELRSRKLKISGKKSELILRLSD